MGLENKNPTSISIDAFYELAERDSELWELIERPTGKQNAAMRDMLLEHWQGFKRALKEQTKINGKLSSREEVAALFVDSFKTRPIPFRKDAEAKARLS